MKTCTTCNASKPLEDFNKRSNARDGRQAKCRECSKTWYNDYYKSNSTERERLYLNNKKYREKLLATVRAKKNVPCMDCKASYPHYVMDFDHQRDKCFTIAKAVAERRPISVILNEIEKCEVVCSNCHRIRTHRHWDLDPL